MPFDPNYKPRLPKDKSNLSIYKIFNQVDFTNDYMLKLLTYQLALKANVRACQSLN